jgi:isopenicillin-N epimerase
MPVSYGPALRPLWLLEPDAIFLNHGSHGATPASVMAAQDALRLRMEAQPVRFMQSELPAALRAAAARLAGFLGGADGKDLVFVENATTAINAVLRSLRFEPGDEILCTTHSYGAVRNAIAHTCAVTGARMVAADIPFPIAGPAQVEAAVAAVLSPRTRLAVLDHVTSATALVLPIERLVRQCSAAGARVLVDAAHAPGMLAMDVPALGADWVTGNAHKWLYAPKGCAFLWASPQAQHGLHPTNISHGLDKGLIAEFDWVGTRDPTAWLAIGAALDFYDAMGGGAIRSYMHGLVCQGASLIARTLGTEMGAPPAMLGAMASVALPPLAPATREGADRVHDALWGQHRIEVPIMVFADRLWVRISAQIYNSLEDYRALAQALRAMANGVR